MKFTMWCSILIACYVLGMSGLQTSRECKPYEPTNECVEGSYRVHLFEKPWLRYPSARIDAHCVYTKPGRVVAQTVRFITYFEYPLQDEISDVWWAEEQEFPPLSPDRISLCRVL